MNQSIPHPFPYQGSKRSLAAKILGFFPSNARRLIEPFAGSAAVSLAALHTECVSSVILGDSDIGLTQLWNEIIHRPEQLADDYKHLWLEQSGKEREFYNQIRAEFNRTHRSDYFLYLLARCVKAAVRYNANGEFNQSPDNRRKGTNPQTVYTHVLGASQLLRNQSSVICADYQELLSLAGLNDIVYLDPPYQGICQKRDPRYKNKVAFDEFVDALQWLNVRHISYIVSYDGKTGSKSHGKLLPTSLQLVHYEVLVGRSAQETLLGRKALTTESLYLSPALVERITPLQRTVQPAVNHATQLDLFTTLTTI